MAGPKARYRPYSRQPGCFTPWMTIWSAPRTTRLLRRPQTCSTAQSSSVDEEKLSCGRLARASDGRAPWVRSEFRCAQPSQRVAAHDVIHLTRLHSEVTVLTVSCRRV